MATIATRPAIHIPTRSMLAALAVALLGIGVIVGYLTAPAGGAPAAGQVSAQVAADNAFVDEWLDVSMHGTQADIEALLRPNVKYRDNAGESFDGAPILASMIALARTNGTVWTRTTDVARAGNVLFWSQKWVANDDPVGTEYTWTVRLDPEGRMVFIWQQYR